MAMFSEERASFRPFGCPGLSVMVGTNEKTVRWRDCEKNQGCPRDTQPNIVVLQRLCFPGRGLQRIITYVTIPTATPGIMGDCPEKLLNPRYTRI